MVARMEKGRQLGSEMIAAVKLGKLSKAADYIQARFADYRKKATPEQHATLLEVATHAANLERQTKTKIEAVLHPEKRYGSFLPGASKNEASADHAGVSQDEVLCDNDHQLYGVFDGMGGYGNGDKASKDAARVVKAALDLLPRNASKTDIAVALKMAFEDAGQAIYDADYNQGIADTHKGGTVGVVAKIHTTVDGKRTAIIAHGGDARAYVRKKDGQLIQLTQDHGLLSNYVKLGRITAAAAKALNEKFSNVINPQTELDDVQVVVGGYTELGLYENGNIVTGFVNKDTEPEITEYELEGGDQLLFTSDGIHDLVPDSHIARAFDSSSSPAETVDRLLNDSKGGIRVGPGMKSDDDRSALVVGMEDVLAPEIERVKNTYLEAARHSEFLPVPLDVVAREAVVLALRVDSSLMKDRVRGQFFGLDSEQGQMPSSVEVAGWRAVGLGDDIDYVVQNVLSDAEPTTSIIPVKPAAEPAEPIDQVKAVRSERLTMNYSDFSRRVLQERQILSLLGSGFVPGDSAEAIRQLDYLDTGAITAEQGLVDTLTELVKLLTDGTLDVAALENSMQVDAIAWKLGISKEAVIETVQAQHAALLHQAAQQEKAGRSIKKALAKGAGYLAAGVGLSMAGVPAGFVMATVAGAKIYDAYTSVGKQTANRKAIETSLLADLTASRDAYATLADADRAASKATGLYKTVLENLAAGLAQRKEEQLRGTQLNSGQLESRYYNLLIRDNLSAEQTAISNAIREYNTAQSAGAPAGEMARLYKIMLETQAVFNQRAEPYRRMAKAQGSLATIDNDTVQLEAKANQSVTPGWLERYPKIAAMLGMRAETVSEKLASVAFFTAMGVAAREHVVVRIAVSGFAGARLGDTLFTLADRALTGEARLLTTTALEDIDPSDGPTAKTQLDKLTGTAAKTREKLLDQDFKRRKPKEYRELQTTLHVYEQLTLASNAQLAIYHMGIQEYNHWQWEKGKKTTKKIFRTALRLGMVGAGAVVGGLIGEQLAVLAAVRAEEQLDQVAPTAPPEPVTPSDTGSSAISDTGDSAVSLTDTGADNSEVSTADEPAVPDAPVAPAPNVPAGEPADPDLPVAPPEAAPSGPGEVTPPPEVSPAPTTTAADLSHVVGKGEGLSHALRGQVSGRELNQLLHDTKVDIDGKSVSLIDTGVSAGGKLSVVVHEVGGHKVIDFYDTGTKAQVAVDDLDQYLYERGHATGAVADVGTAVPEPAVRALESDVAFRAPDLAHDTATSYVAEGLRDYVNTHRDYSYLSPLNDNTLADQPELLHVANDLRAEYQAVVFHPIEPAAPLGGGGGLPEPAPAGAADNAFSSLEPGADYTNAFGELNAAGMKEANLQEHFTPGGEMQDYEHFKSDMLALISDKKNHDIRTPNHLTFEDRGGVLCVDVTGSPKEYHRVTPELYAALMEHFKDTVKPGYNGRFDQDEFKAVLQKVE